MITVSQKGDGKMESFKKHSRKHGPLQIVHDFKFTALNVKDDYTVLDTLDYSGKVDYIKSRIDKLNRMGYGGVVMNVDYKGYLKNPDAFTLFFECAEYAKSLGLSVWIYDEQYYPSGGAGGVTLEGHPEFEAAALVEIRIVLIEFHIARVLHLDHMPVAFVGIFVWEIVSVIHSNPH